MTSLLFKKPQNKSKNILNEFVERIQPVLEDPDCSLFLVQAKVTDESIELGIVADSNLSTPDLNFLLDLYKQLLMSGNV